MTQATANFDRSLLFVSLSLLVIGLIMVASASITIADSKMSQPLYYFIRQAIFAVVGLVIAGLVVSIRLSFWQRFAPQLLMIGVGL